MHAHKPTRRKGQEVRPYRLNFQMEAQLSSVNGWLRKCAKGYLGKVAMASNEAGVNSRLSFDSAVPIVMPA